MLQNKLFHEQTENIIKTILPFFIIFSFITTIAGSWVGYLVHHPFNMGDWLINYNAGFVRRGFLGSVIIYLSYIRKGNI